MNKIILSLCDYSGEWCKPYREAGYETIQVDLKFGEDIRLYKFQNNKKIFGILAAPPCTHLASSGARWWKKKGSGPLLENLALVDACLRIITVHKPKFWALENPVGRLRRYLGPPSLIFDPCDYGDPYTKKTLLWGNFNTPVKTPVKPIRSCIQGSWVQKLGGSSERTKELRSQTPAGFARAFYLANQ